jgi:predicted MFS family arabinose efflux permease
MQSYFGYGEFENSLVFMAGGLEAILAFCLVSYLSGKVRETTLLTTGWILMILPQIWLMLTMPYYKEGILLLKERKDCS